MPRDASLVKNSRELVAMVRATAQAADRAYAGTGIPVYGMEFRQAMADYNQLVSVAARLMGEEVTRLFRPYDLALIPPPRKIEPKTWGLHFLQVSASLKHFALYLEAKLEPDAIVAE